MPTSAAAPGAGAVANKPIRGSVAAANAPAARSLASAGRNTGIRLRQRLIYETECGFAMSRFVWDGYSKLSSRSLEVAARRKHVSLIRERRLAAERDSHADENDRQYRGFRSMNHYETPFKSKGNLSSLSAIVGDHRRKASSSRAFHNSRSEGRGRRARGRHQAAKIRETRSRKPLLRARSRGAFGTSAHAFSRTYARSPTTEKTERIDVQRTFGPSRRRA